MLLATAAAAPTFAATRTHHHAKMDRGTVRTDRGYNPGYSAYGAAQGWGGGAAYGGGNLPYSDRPYGDPDSW